MLLGLILGIAAVAAALIGVLSGAFASLAWLWVLPVSFVGAVLAQALLGFGFLMILVKRVDMDVPQEEDDPLYRRVADLYIKTLLPILRVHVKTQGLEKTPREGRFMLVCNHNNNADPIILMRYFQSSQLAFISKRENKDMFVIGPMMHKLQCQLINRENDREALKTILACIRILKEDKASVAVFPEGGINEDMKLHHFRSGVFKIAQKANVPIVVCTLKNTDHVMDNVIHFRRSDVELHLIDVIPAEELAGVPTTQIAQRVHAMMAQDLGADLVAED